MVRDLVDPVADERLANFVVNSHINSHPHTRAAAEAAEMEGEDAGAEGEKEKEEPISSVFGVRPLPQDMLRKYIIYSKSCKPKLQHMNQEKVSS